VENYVTHVYVYNEGNVEDGLLGFAQEINAGLLALGTHHHSRLMGVLSPGSQQNIIHYATRPVWTFNSAMAAARAKPTEEDNYNCLL
jgi:hypothetical protein